MSLSSIKLFFVRATLPFVGQWTSVFVFRDSFSTSSARPQACKNLLWNPLRLQTNPGQWDRQWCWEWKWFHSFFSFFCDLNFESTVVPPTARPPTNSSRSFLVILCAASRGNSEPSVPQEVRKFSYKVTGATKSKQGLYLLKLVIIVVWVGSCLILFFDCRPAT